MQNVSVCLMLIWPNGRLVITRHNKIHDIIIHLTKQNFYHNDVCGETLIHQGRSRSEEEVRHIGSVPETRGGVSIRGISEIMMEEIIDVRFGDDDAYSWRPVRMDRFLSSWEKLK